MRAFYERKSAPNRLSGAQRIGLGYVRKGQKDERTEARTENLGDMFRNRLRSKTSWVLVPLKPKVLLLDQVARLIWTQLTYVKIYTILANF